MIEAHQRRRLAETVSHAYRHVPYYRETMARLGLGPGDISSAADLARLPLLAKSDVQRDPERFVSDLQPIERYVPLHTGGTTAEPLAVYYDPFALVQRGGHHQRARSVYRQVVGRRLGHRTLLIAPAPVASRGPVDRMFAGLRKLTGAKFNRVSISEPVERGVEEIDRFRPHIVQAPGSYVEALFVFLQASGTEFHRPRLIVYSGDAISKGVRALISEDFGIPVLSLYGANEAFDMGFECLAHLGLHFNVDIYPLRIVDDWGREVPGGQSGEVVISNLVNRGTTLLNYRLGDVARRLPTRCPCGRTLPLISFVDTRMRDWLLTPSGRRLHPLAVTGILDVDCDLLRYQVRQEALARLRVDLVARPAGDRGAIRIRVERGFAELLGPGATVEVAFVEDLPRTAQGKIRSVIGLERAGLGSDR